MPRRTDRPVAAARLDASVFTVVMATGIVSVAATVERMPVLSDVLFAVAVAAWLVLCAGVVLCLLHRRASRPRLASFAFVAATAVAGTRFALTDLRVVALAFWALAVAAWLILLMRRPRPMRPSGGWLLIVVATESLAVLSAMVASELGADSLDAALAWWILGLALYPVVVAAIGVSVYRSPRFSADLWVTMGALAIATLAETELLAAARAMHALAGVRPALRTAGLVTWALASAWVLPLTAADVRNRAGWRFESSRWSFVFPLGMYTVATKTLGDVVGVPPLRDVATAAFVVAVLAWALTFAGLGRAALEKCAAPAPARRIRSMTRYLHTMYRITDPGRSRRFYEALGFEFRRELPIVRDGQLEATNYFFGVPGQDEELELTFNHDGRTYEMGSAYGHIALAVDDLDRTLARLREQGIEPEREPYRVREGGSRLCFVRDPDEYRIELIERG